VILYLSKYISGAFTTVGIIDYATSVIWIKRFNDAGAFELYIRADADLLKLFSENEIYIARPDSDAVMIAENVNLDTDDENGDYLTITGRSAESLLGRRIIPSQSTFQNQTAENVVRSLITANVIDPSDARRKIDCIKLGASKGYTTRIDKQVTGKNLLETISDVCKEQKYGFEFTFANNEFTFNLYTGVDRSYNQSENTFVVFSPAFENLGNTQYSKDKTTLYNSVYVAGEGEGTARVIINAQQLPTAKTGLELRELWTDARNTSSNGGDIPIGEYSLLLYNQGLEDIAIATETTKFNGEILNSDMYVYGVDYNLGDTVQIENEYGITGTAVVTEITEVEDANGYKIYPTLSEWSV
jgi:hypothetical protein